MFRLRHFTLLAVACVLLSACHVDAQATTRMQADGSGEVEARVTLDPEATRALEAGGGTLDTRIVVTDLAAAGWRVDPWERRPDGSSSLAAHKAFARPEEVTAIYAEISGERGPFRNVRASRNDGLFTTEWSFRGELDLTTPDAGVASDAELVQKVTAAGLDPTGVQELLSSAVGSSLGVSNRVELPSGTPAEWVAPRTEVVEMRARTSRLAPVRGLVLIAGGVLVVVGLVFFVASEARARRIRARRRARTPRPARPR